MADNSINEIMTGLDKVDAKIESISKEAAEGKASSAAAQAEIKKLGDAQAKLAKDLAEIQQKNVRIEDDKAAAASVGEQFVKSASYKAFGDTRKAHAEIKAATPATTAASNSTTRTTIAPAYQAGFVALPEQELVVENLLPHVPVSASSIEYVKEGSSTIGASVVAEGAAKPESTFSFSLATASVVTVAHWTKITKQLAEDDSSIAAFINTKMQYGLQQKIDQQLIQGDGTSNTLKGLLATGNYTDYSTAAGATSSDTLIDFALKVKSALEQAYIAPQYLVLNPADWTTLALLKDGQKRYILGGPATMAAKTLWGVPVVTTSSMPKGKFLLGNFTQAATIYDRQSIEVAMSDSDDQNFTTNLITLRVERRLGLSVELPMALAGGDFAVPASA